MGGAGARGAREEEGSGQPQVAVPGMHTGWKRVPGAVQHAVVPVPQTVHGQKLQPAAGVYARQVPATHSWPTAQAVPHVPQFAASVAVL